MVPADAELVARSRRRDADAFGMLVERHQRLVFGVALARCQDPALAEDVAQEAFVSAWRDLDRLRDGDRVGSWVAGIARNLAANAARRRDRQRPVLITDTAAPSPEDEALEREDRELLQRALADVPDTHREALVLYYLEGESIARIADALGISEDLVKQRLSRGRRALREGVATRVFRHSASPFGDAARPGEAGPCDSALVRARSGAALRAGVVAAVTLAGTREAGAATVGTAGKVIALMSTKKLVLGAVIVVLAVTGGVFWFNARARTADDSGPPAPVSGAAPSVASPAPPTGATPPRVRKLADPALRSALLEKIHARQQQRGAASSSSSSSGGVVPPPSLPDSTPDKVEKEYIRAAMRELVPMLGDCYAEGLERDPKMAEGKLVVEFTIEGEPGVGGVIGESHADAASSDIKDATVLECIESTMYALEIDPPASGGNIRVRYPFQFARAPAPGSDASRP